MILAHAALTHVGLVRSANEDAFVVLPRGAVVADGLGGHAAGEVASSIAVRVIGAAVMELDERATQDVVIEKLRGAFREAAAECARHVAAHPAAASMGTTVVACWIGVGVCVLAHVGDSRGYLLRPDRTAAVTRDHSHVMEWVAAGALTREEARVHPESNRIKRAISASMPWDPEVRVLRVAPGDRLALVTDGATDPVPEVEFLRLARGSRQARGQQPKRSRPPRCRAEGATTSRSL